MHTVHLHLSIAPLYYAEVASVIGTIYPPEGELVSRDAAYTPVSVRATPCASELGSRKIR